MSDLVERLLEHASYLQAMDESTKTEIVLQTITAMEQAAAHITELETSLAEVEGRVIAEVVAWLRGQAKAGDKAIFQAIDSSQLRRDLAAGVVAINRAATALETGEWKK